MTETDGVSEEGGISARLMAVAAALAKLDGLPELLAAVELLAARCGRDELRGGAAIALRDSLVKCLVAYRGTFWEVPRLKFPDLAHVDGTVESPAVSDQLAAVLPSLQAVTSPEVALEVLAEVERVAVRRLGEGGWSPLWYEVRQRVRTALVVSAGEDVGGSAKATSHDPVFFAEISCNQRLYAEGKPYRRTCRACGLGPCRDAHFMRKDYGGRAL